MITRIERSIVKHICSGDFALTVHARERMNERFVSELDIVEVARTLKSIKYQEKNDTYLLTGYDTWNEILIISVALREKVVIVTVFFKE